MNDQGASAANARSVSLADEEAVRQVLTTSVFGLWDVVNNLTRLRPSRRDRYRVALFGSARVQPGTFAYEETKRLAAALAQLDCDVITGGGPGLMRAANEGAAQSSDRVHLRGNPRGSTLRAGSERVRDRGLRTPDLLHPSASVRPRLGRLHRGAWGRRNGLETMMIWQLLQVKHLEKTPLILVGDMWQGLVDWARTAMLATTPPLASAEDFDIPQCVRGAMKPSRFFASITHNGENDTDRPPNGASSSGVIELVQRLLDRHVSSQVSDLFFESDRSQQVANTAVGFDHAQLCSHGRAFVVQFGKHLRPCDVDVGSIGQVAYDQPQRARRGHSRANLAAHVIDVEVDKRGFHAKDQHAGKRFVVRVTFDIVKRDVPRMRPRMATRG